jgi:transcriptional regulator with XRE-family HTH domain
MKIGSKIKGLRVEKGMTTTKMAELLGISDPTYRRYENDKSFPDIVMVDNIAKVLGIFFLDLLPDAIVFTNNDQKGGIALAYQSTINQQNEKLVEQYEKRIFEKCEHLKEKDEIIIELKIRLKKYEE